MLSTAPAVLWLLVAQIRIATLKATYGTELVGDLGQIQSVLQLARRATIDLLEVRPFFVTTPKMMASVYTFLPSWPSGSLLAPWALIGSVWGTARLLSESDRAVRKALLTIPAMGMVTFPIPVLERSRFRALEYALPVPVRLIGRTRVYKIEIDAFCKGYPA